jgi:hypothetical protein
MSKVTEFLKAVGEVAYDAATGPIAREAFNDARNTVHEIYTGTPERPPEPGTPMAPTQREVYEQKQEAEIGPPAGWDVAETSALEVEPAKDAQIEPPKDMDMEI